MNRNRSLPAVLLCGYYGQHNLGDDALLAALLASVPSSWRVIATAADQRRIREQFRIRTCSRRRPLALLLALLRSRVLVLGGGSLLQDTTSFRSLLYYLGLILTARLLGRSVLLWGQGLGPLRGTTAQRLVRLILPMVQGISWRDPDSAALAARWGIEGETGRDPVWSLLIPTASPDAKPAVSPAAGSLCLCWRPTPLLDAAGWQRLRHFAVERSRTLQVSVCLVPFHRHQDGPFLEAQAERLQAAGVTCRFWHPDSPEAFVQGLAGAHLVVAMRLHALILAAMADCPLMALSYDPKVQSAAAAMAIPHLDLHNPAALDDLPSCGDQAMAWRLSTEKLDEHRQRNGCHKRLLDRYLV